MSRLPGQRDPYDAAVGCLALCALGLILLCTLRGLCDVVAWLLAGVVG